MHSKLLLRTTLAGLSVATVMSSVICTPVFAQEVQRSYNIPSQSLGAALVEFSKQSEVVITAPSELTKGKNGNALRGAMTAEQALTRLLKGTGLTARATGAQTYSLFPFDGRNPTRASESASSSGPTGFADKETGEGPVEMGEIVVTAQRRDQRLQDVPLNLNVVTGQDMQAAGATDIKDVLSSIPGLAFSGSDRGLSRYTINGIAPSDGLAATVGIYLDDVPVTTDPGAFTGAQDLVLFDMERIEVLKGPQGTLYGGSAMGGAIKYITAKPNASSFSVDVSTGVAATAHGSESYNIEGVVNAPLISDKLSLRLGIYYNHEGGYIDNVAGLDAVTTAYSSTPFPTYTPLVRNSLAKVSKADYNYSETYAGRAQLLWEPDDSWSIRSAITYQLGKRANPGYFFLNYMDELAASTRLVDQVTRDEGRILSLDIEKRFGGVKLHSITAHYDRSLVFDRDYSFFIGSLLPSFYTSDYRVAVDTQVKNFSQELRLSSDGASSRVNWLIGAFYAKSDTKFEGRIGAVAGPNAPAVFLYSDSVFDRTEQAIFGDFTYEFLRGLEVTAGARVYKIKNATQRFSSGLLPAAGASGGFPPLIPDPVLRSSESGVSPKIGLSYKIDRDRMLYVSAAKGFRPGGTLDPNLLQSFGCGPALALYGYNTIPDGYKSDSLWTYSVGSKNEFGKRVRFNAAAYYSVWRDIQQSVGLSCGQTLFVNAGEAHVKGQEAELSFQLAQGLEISGNVSHTSARLAEAAFDGLAQKGDRILNMPEWIVGVRGSYSTPVAQDWDLTFRADYQYRSDQKRSFTGNQNVVYLGPPRDSRVIDVGHTVQSGYDVVNASVTLSSGRTGLRLYADNLFDARPLLDLDRGQTASRGTTLRPLTVGLELNQRF